jgi:hypothetical protein
MGVLPTLSIFGWGILFGWIAAKGFNPKAAVQRQRDLELGQWLRKRAKALPVGCNAPPVAGGLIDAMSYQKDRK